MIFDSTVVMTGLPPWMFPMMRQSTRDPRVALMNGIKPSFVARAPDGSIDVVIDGCRRCGNLGHTSTDVDRCPMMRSSGTMYHTCPPSSSGSSTVTRTHGPGSSRAGSSGTGKTCSNPTCISTVALGAQWCSAHICHNDAHDSICIKSNGHAGACCRIPVVYYPDGTYELIE